MVYPRLSELDIFKPVKSAAQSQGTPKVGNFIIHMSSDNIRPLMRDIPSTLLICVIEIVKKNLLNSGRSSNIIFMEIRSFMENKMLARKHYLPKKKFEK